MTTGRGEAIKEVKDQRLYLYSICVLGGMYYVS